MRRGSLGVSFTICRPTFNGTQSARNRIFQASAAHPSLQFKKLESEDSFYSARIGLDYRAVAVMKKDRIVWYWIGNHSDYDRLM